MATMQKWQMEHFEDKVKRQFNPLIQDQELLIKQYRTQATNVAVGKLAKKMGADKIINDFICTHFFSQFPYCNICCLGSILLD